MSVVSFSGVFWAVSLFAIANAYRPVGNPMPMLTSPSWYDSRYGASSSTSCRESIKDLKDLIELTQSLRQEINRTECDTCARNFNEEVILKLINLLVITATRNCGYDVNTNQGGNNIGVWNANGGYMGGNTILVGGPLAGGCGTGLLGPGGAGATNTGSKNTDSLNDALIKLGLLDGKNTLDLDVGKTEVLEVNVGNVTGGKTATTSGDAVKKDDPLIELGVLDGKNTLDLAVGGKDVLEANVANIVGGKTTTNNGTKAGTKNDKRAVKDIYEEDNGSTKALESVPNVVADNNVSKALAIASSTAEATSTTTSPVVPSTPVISDEVPAANL